MTWEWRTFQATSSAKHRAAVNVDYFPGDKGCQVGGGKEDWSGDFFGGADTFQRDGNQRAFQPGLGAQYRSGHIRIHPAWGDAIHDDVVGPKLGGQSLDETDDRAFRGAVVGVIGFAALPGGGTDGHDAAAFLGDHVRSGVVNHGVNALQVDANHFVPFAFGQLVDGRIFFIPDTGVGHQDVDAPQALAGEID